MKKLLISIALLHSLVAYSTDLKRVGNLCDRVLNLPLEEARLEIANNRHFINNARDDNGGMILHAAVCTRKYQRIQALLELGASTEVKNDDMETPLHIAVKEGNQRAVALLLEYNANVHVWEHFEYRTPLHYAVEFNRIQCARMLLDAGASPHAPGLFVNRQQDYHYSAKDLAVAAYEDEPEKPMRKLLEEYQGVSLNWKDAFNSAFPAGIESLAQ